MKYRDTGRSRELIRIPTRWSFPTKRADHTTRKTCFYRVLHPACKTAGVPRVYSCRTRTVTSGPTKPIGYEVRDRKYLTLRVRPYDYTSVDPQQ
jgi:hypothetical protein